MDIPIFADDVEDEFEDVYGGEEEFEGMSTDDEFEGDGAADREDKEKAVGVDDTAVLSDFEGSVEEEQQELYPNNDTDATRRDRKNDGAGMSTTPQPATAKSKKKHANGEGTSGANECPQVRTRGMTQPAGNEQVGTILRSRGSQAGAEGLKRRERTRKKGHGLANRC
ncbi:hypothetical protein CJ030_MR2G020021 [Morella rubra]|uniref:Uncharacterized protein n=1 Tax=Morella rubra TaxID=262757 RepID=A0A6A1WJC3_9ROSI|nr:hypothetical protein CJ030_MR2G020021 [Morella rubra]